MTDIPEDIEKKVREVRNQLCIEYECTFDAGCGCREAIARAILAERARCAQIAENAVDYHDDGLSTFDAAQVIASAIRNEGEQKT